MIKLRVPTSVFALHAFVACDLHDIVTKTPNDKKHQNLLKSSKYSTNKEDLHILTKFYKTSKKDLKIDQESTKDEHH